ncbi:RNA-binding S4 domain-containing protein [Luteimonas mephitis]|uniref:RNA-binding S4 domain-containing protein n=1 Tax=Luteimonas mephitis TaxID=83615 RepID=UPI00055CFA53|nr:RNA-binding S4 domain-containing protein [Luteimonas mephitis]
MPRQSDRAQRKPGDPAAPRGVRLDLWLWAARFFKTRSLSRQAIETGKVEVDGQRTKASREVKPGDAMTIVRNDGTFAIEVVVVSDRRGPAAAAQALYRESEQSRLAREARRDELRAGRAGYRAPEGKPDKRARRLIRALGDLDAS